MPYPDIREPKNTELIGLVTFLPEILLIVTAPVWISVWLVWGFEDLWFAVWMGVLLTIAAACFGAALLPTKTIKRTREFLGLPAKKA